MRLLLIVISTLLSIAAAQPSLNILVYHHVDSSTPASTSLSPVQFETHLKLLKDNNFNVVRLDEAIDTLINGGELPPKAVALTFDDAYRNVYTNAFPLLKKYNFPFTVFAATDAVDSGRSDTATWEQLRAMKQWGAIIANHTKDHDYLVRHPRLDEAWRLSVKQNIEHAQQRLIAELGNDTPNWLAYPYGEYSVQLQQLLIDMGYVGFAQHSGGLDKNGDFTAIPRFAAAGIYANPATLITKLNSKPMPIDHSQVADMLTNDKTPLMTATLIDAADVNRNLNCFVNGNWQAFNWLDRKTFTLQAETELSVGRHRYNCTAKSLSGDFFYWLSKPWLVVDEAGL